jgi:hypothetical protein
MLSELKAYVEKLQQEPPARKPPAAPGDRYPFEMKPYDPPKEIKRVGTYSEGSSKNCKRAIYTQ